MSKQTKTTMNTLNDNNVSVNLDEFSEFENIEFKTKTFEQKEEIYIKLINEINQHINKIKSLEKIRLKFLEDIELNNEGNNLDIDLDEESDMSDEELTQPTKSVSKSKAKPKKSAVSDEIKDESEDESKVKETPKPKSRAKKTVKETTEEILETVQE